MSTTTPQLQGVATQFFKHLAEETIYTILYFLLVREEPIHVGVCLVDPPFSDVSFHELAWTKDAFRAACFHFLFETAGLRASEMSHFPTPCLLFSYLYYYTQ